MWCLRMRPARGWFLTSVLPANLEDLDKGGLIVSGTNMLYAKGRIGLWPRDGSPFYPDNIQELTRPEVKRIAIANPEHAPYGMAAMQAFQSANIWDVVRPKLVMAENASQTLQYAKTGNVDVAIVPLSLVVQNTNSHWVLIPENFHQPIEQTSGIIRGTPHGKEAYQFIALINSHKGRDIMRKYGFTLPGEELPR
ncbi:MAG: molybdenum transporter, periplasmic molybdate-binding protein [Dehalococcoidia bacterium]|nr:molybdenum transporter, periplasmic molybdate-binding protein [Dehalococcoidia bacterium]